MTNTTWMGKAVKRIEDAKLLQGQGMFLDDLKIDDALHMMVVRSTRAHARIESIDTSEALSINGVVAVITAQDINHLPAVPGDSPKGGNIMHHPLLAKDTVHYVGQAVAVVLAKTKMAAEDAAFAITVNYQDLPVVVSPFDSLENTHLLHPNLGSNVAYQKRTLVGTPDDIFAKAHKIVGASIQNQRVAPSSMECRGVAASWDGTTLTVWSSTQGAHNLRDEIAETLSIKKDSIHVITPDVGGGFGAKYLTYPEDILVASLAQKYKALKWVESRSENLLSMTHGRDQIGNLEVACDENARVLGMRGRIVADIGAYLVTLTADCAIGTLPMLQGPYEHLRHFDLELVEVYTNKVPVSAYRGAGRPEATFFLERLMNMVAHEFKLDPAEVRRRNFISKDSFPYKTSTNVDYDSGDYQNALDILLEKSNYAQWLQEQTEARKQGRYIGLGLATYVECCAYGWDNATVRLNQNGTATVLTGTSPHGQGTATGFAQIVAEALGIAPEKIEVVFGDTKKVRTGQGTAGSRTLAVGGSAIFQAAKTLQEKLFKLAEHALEASTRDLELIPGAIQVRGVPSKSISIQVLAEMASNDKTVPEDLRKLEESSKFDIPAATSPFGAHLCVVEVDAATGEVKILDYICVDDCGVVMNPMLVDGQVHGGVAQAIGQALYEQVVYDKYGQNTTGSLMEYILPRAHLLPSYQTHRTVTPSHTNPLGVKGVGEAGTIGGTPAVANAVIDALKPFGVRHMDMPFWAGKVWEAIQRPQLL
jgi:aerobic carbon-monoxide dehydrogenase large subunit